MRLTILLFLASLAVSVSGGIAVARGETWLVHNTWAIYIAYGLTALLLAAVVVELLSEKLTIHLAEWGPGPSDGDYSPVTKTVVGYIKDNRTIEMQASDAVLGDLYPGRPKHLRVVYSCRGARRKPLTVKHNDWLRLPER